MGDKRKSYAVILLKIRGKTHKLEMFPRKLWESDNNMGNKYRVRFNGKWFPKDELRFFTKTEIKELLFRNI